MRRSRSSTAHQSTVRVAATVRRCPREDCVMRERVSLVSDLTGAPFYRLARACHQGTSLGIDARTSRWAMREMRW